MSGGGSSLKVTNGVLLEEVAYSDDIAPYTFVEEKASLNAIESEATATQTSISLALSTKLAKVTDHNRRYIYYVYNDNAYIMYIARVEATSDGVVLKDTFKTNIDIHDMFETIVMPDGNLCIVSTPHTSPDSSVNYCRYLQISVIGTAETGMSVLNNDIRLYDAYFPETIGTSYRIRRAMCAYVPKYNMTFMWIRMEYVNLESMYTGYRWTFAAYDFDTYNPVQGAATKSSSKTPYAMFSYLDDKAILYSAGLDSGSDDYMYLLSYDNDLNCIEYDMRGRISFVGSVKPTEWILSPDNSTVLAVYYSSAASGKTYGYIMPMELLLDAEYSTFDYANGGGFQIDGSFPYRAEFVENQYLLVTNLHSTQFTITSKLYKVIGKMSLSEADTFSKYYAVSYYKGSSVDTFRNKETRAVEIVEISESNTVSHANEVTPFTCDSGLVATSGSILGITKTKITRNQKGKYYALSNGAGVALTAAELNEVVVNAKNAAVDEIKREVTNVDD